MTTHALSVGARVRVVGKDVTPKFLGAVGAIASEPDCFGRWGVRLDAFPRKHPHWLHWFAGEALAPEGEGAKVIPIRECAACEAITP